MLTSCRRAARCRVHRLALARGGGRSVRLVRPLRVPEPDRHGRQRRARSAGERLPVIDLRQRRSAREHVAGHTGSCATATIPTNGRARSRPCSGISGASGDGGAAREYACDGDGSSRCSRSIARIGSVRHGATADRRTPSTMPASGRDRDREPDTPDGCTDAPASVAALVRRWNYKSACSAPRFGRRCSSRPTSPPVSMPQLRHDDRVRFPLRDGRLLRRAHSGLSSCRSRAPGTLAALVLLLRRQPFAGVARALVARDAGAGSASRCRSRSPRCRRPSISSRCVRVFSSSARAGSRFSPISFYAAAGRAIRSALRSDLRARMGLTTLHLTNAYHPTSGGIRTFYTALLEAAGIASRRSCWSCPARRRRVDRGWASSAASTSCKAPRAPAFDRRYRLVVPIGTPLTGRELVGSWSVNDPISSGSATSIRCRIWRRCCASGGIPGAAAGAGGPGLRAVRRQHGGVLFTTGAARAFTRWYIRHIYGPPFDCPHRQSPNTRRGSCGGTARSAAAGSSASAPMGVHADEFGPERRRAATAPPLLAYAGGTERSTLLLYAGRVSPEKNTELLLQTLRLLANDRGADYRLVVAGDGPALPGLRRLANEWGLSGRLLLCGNLDADARELLCELRMCSCIRTRASRSASGRWRQWRPRTPRHPVRRGRARLRVIHECLARRANRSGVCRCGAGRPPRRPRPDSGSQRHRPSVQVERGDAALLRAVRGDLRIVDRCVTTGGVTSS